MGIVQRATVPVKLGDPRTRAMSLDTELIRRQAAVKTKFKDTVRLAADSAFDESREERLAERLSRTDVLLRLLPIDQLKDMRDVFNMFDDDGSGSITAAEVSVAFQRLKLVTNRAMLRAIVEHIDVDGDGRIDFGEFCALMTQRRKPAFLDEEDKDDADPAAGLEVAGEVDDVVAGAADAALDMAWRRGEHATNLAKEQERQEAIRYFKRTVSFMAFRKSDSDPSSPRAGGELSKVLKQLWLRPAMRTEWELQRVLHWSERFAFIQQLPPAVQSDQRIDVCRMLKARLVKAGEVIYRQGDSGDCMYFLFAGEVELRRTSESVASSGGSSSGRAQTTVKKECESFGEVVVVSVAADERRDETASAVADCTVAELSRHDWTKYVRTQSVAYIVEILQAHPAMATCKRGLLLRMALELKPVQYYRCVCC